MATKMKIVWVVSTLILSALAQSHSGSGYTGGGKDNAHGGKDNGYGGKDNGYGGKDNGYGGNGGGNYNHGGGGHDGYNDHGYGGGGGGGRAPHHPSAPSVSARLAALQDFIHKIQNERAFLKNKVAMTKTLKGQLLNKLDQIDKTTIPAFESLGSAQNDRLDTIRNQIQSLLMTAGQLESDLAGQKTLSKTNEAFVNPLRTRINEQLASNTLQSAHLVTIDVRVDETKEKLGKKVATNADIANNQVEELRQNTVALKELVDSRKCFTDLAIVEFNSSSQGYGEAQVVFDPMDIFGGNVPTVFCALESFETQLDLGSSRPVNHGYGDRQNLALTVDCKPFTDKVKVMAFDQSQGNGNSVRKALVEVKACTLGAQA